MDRLGDEPVTSVRRPHGYGGVLAAIVCGLVGAAFAVLPHFAWYLQPGKPKYFADNDDLLYLAIAARSFHDHPVVLSDPSTASGAATIYDWLQFVPGVLLARGLGWEALDVNLAWRLIAGVSLGVAWFVLLSFLLGRRGLALALTLFILADCGFFTARPMLKQLGITAYLLTGNTSGIMDAIIGEKTAEIFAAAPTIHRQWRIITPAMSHAYLVVFIYLWMRARKDPALWRITFSGLGFGVLFYVYFYNWVAVGLALLLGVLLDAGNRRVALLTGVIGGTVGALRVWERYQIKHETAADWLLRSDLFLPIPRTTELIFPKVALLLLVFTAFWVWRRRRDLLPIWLLALASLGLMNHQVLSGLQIQNNHWMNILGACLSLLFVLFGADRVRRVSAAWRLILWLACLGYVAVGLGLRWVEATRSQDTLRLVGPYGYFRAQTRIAGASHLQARSMIAGDQMYIDFATVVDNLRPLMHYAVRLSPSVDDEELMVRTGLNEYVRGVDRTSFDRSNREFLFRTPWGPWARDPEARERRAQQFLAAYDRIVKDPEAAMDRFRVRYLALPSGSALPATTGRWKQVQEGPTWDVWERRVAGVDPQ
jgi:hypothetical protein